MKKSNLDNEFLSQLTFEPLARANWAKFVQLFGNKEACGNCWCMYYRLPKADFAEGKAEDGNKEAMQNLVYDNKPTGILVFYEGQHFIKLERSRVHKRIDDLPVWSVPCFFNDKTFRPRCFSGASERGLSGMQKKVTFPS